MNRIKYVNRLPKPLRHSTRRAQREMRKKQLAPKKRWFNKVEYQGHFTLPKPSDKQLYSRGKHGDRDSLKAPDDFSIIRDDGPVFELFNTLRLLAGKRRKVFLDISDVRNISLDAIVYLLWLFEYLKKTNKPLDIVGNIPNDNRTKQLLLASGFFDWVKSPHLSTKTDASILAIESNNMVLPAIAKKVVIFLRNHLKQPKSEITKTTYKTIIELMNNTREHAYKKDASFPRWYIAAHHCHEDNKVTLTFLDGGMGIPHTINTKFSEKIRAILSRSTSLLEELKISDSDLILSAMKGEFRTRTRQGYRGKGLPGIKDACDKGNISNLTVVSNRGFVNIDQGDKFDLDCTFRGTLFSWEFHATEGGPV